MAREALVLGLLAAGGLTAYVVTRGGGGSGGGDSGGSQAQGGPGGLGGFVDAGSLGPVDPDAMFQQDPGSGPDSGPGPGGFSPDFEAALLQEQRRATDASLREQRRDTNLQAGILGAGVGIYGAAKVGAAIRSAPVQRAIRLSPAAGRAATAARVAGIAGAGVAVGTGAVAVLDRTGVLDDVEDYGRRQSQGASDREISVVKNVALPLSVPGAVIAGLAGRGSIRGNLREAFQGTVFS